MPRELITESERISAAVGAENAKRYHFMPGIVTAFHAPVQGVSAAAVDVQPAVHDVRFCVADDVPTQGLIAGQRYSEPWPAVLPRVPVRYLTLGGFALWGPLKAGDRVLLLGFDLDPSTHLVTGEQADPPMTRRNSGTHWVALPGDITDPGALPDPGQALCFGTPGGVMVAVDAAAVNLGAAHPTDFAALATKIDALNVLLKTFAAAMGAITFIPASGATALQAAALNAAAQALQQGVPATVASTIVKIAP